MDFCRIADRLYAAVPLRPFRDWLIRAHMERCPACQERLLSREEARGLLVSKEALGAPGDLWRRIAAGEASRTAAAEARPARGVPAWRWASAAAMAAVVALTGFWLLRQTGRPGFELAAVAPTDRFEIAYVNVGGAPAQTFVYQPQGTDTVLVWATRNP
mgnify:FL=1